MAESTPASASASASAYPSPNLSGKKEEDESPNKRRKRHSEAELKKLLLLSYSKDCQLTEDALDDIVFVEWSFHFYGLSMLKDQLGIPIEKREGLDVYKIPDTYALDEIFGLRLRESRLYVERDCYPLLFDRIMKLWEGKISRSFVVTGNAGTGKSWFQIYFLRRLLSDYERSKSGVGPPCLVRFVLRQFESNFHLLDLETCRGWKVNSENGPAHYSLVQPLIATLKHVLYLYEPGMDKDKPPTIFSSTPCLSTMSPNPNRLKEYQKLATPGYLYMPLWEFEQLAVVAEHEKKIDREVLEIRYSTFGGIIRRTLEYDDLVSVKYQDDLDNRIPVVSTDVLRSMHFGLDDNSDGQAQNNISGYIAAYTNIPFTGNDAFTVKDMAMTSKYACIEVRKKLSLENPRRHAEMLAKCLNKESRDITGIDLEVSAAHMISSGPRVVKWEYNAVGGPPKRPAANKLGLTKMEVYRGTTIDELKLNYPADSIFGLVDFFVFSKGECWAFQTTWQDSHAFKLSTLWSFRNKIGYDETKRLNILYVVPPDKLDTYRKRSKLKYLARGEMLDRPILEQKKEVLTADKARTMWNSTNIFVAFPEKNDWHASVEAWLKTPT